MTTFGKNAKNPAMRTRLDELDVMINAAIVSGDDKSEKELTELRKDLSDFFDSLEEIFDNSAEERLKKILDKETKKFLENTE